MSAEEISSRPMIVAFVILENSSNEMTQNTWAFCVASVRETIHRYAWNCEEWFTEPSSGRQSVCWGIQVFTDHGTDEKLRAELGMQARAWKPKSIEWVQAPRIERIRPV